MTAPTEPLKLTLEEAMHEHRRRRQAEPYLGDVWMDHDGKWRRKAIAGPGTIHDNWPEAFSESWGVPVVARDDAAELRAAVGIARAAMVDALAFHHHVLSGPVKAQLNTAINTADSALAATEGRGEP